MSWCDDIARTNSKSHHGRGFIKKIVPKHSTKRCFEGCCVCHESWNFPAGVSFALKQNMYWGGFCAFLPDISGLGGGGGPNPCKNQQI